MVIMMVDMVVNSNMASQILGILEITTKKNLKMTMGVIKAMINIKINIPNKIEDIKIKVMVTKAKIRGDVVMEDRETTNRNLHLKTIGLM